MLDDATMDNNGFEFSVSSCEMSRDKKPNLLEKENLMSTCQEFQGINPKNVNCTKIKQNKILKKKLCL